MKKVFITLLAVAFATCRMARAEQEVPVVTAESFLTEVKAADTGEKRAKAAELAFRSERIDLVLACFRAPGMFGDFIRQMEELPGNEFKNQIVIMLLREKWPYDKTSNGLPQPGSHPPPRLEVACLKVLAKLLPAEGLSADNYQSVERLSDPQYREKLAQVFDASKNGRQNPSKTSSQTSEPVGFPENSEKGSFNGGPSNLRKSEFSGKASISTTRQNGSPQSRVWVVVGVVIAASIAIIWLWRILYPRRPS